MRRELPSKFQHMATPIDHATRIWKRPDLPVNAIGGLIVLAALMTCWRLLNPMRTFPNPVDTNRWVGFSENALIQKFGQPSSITPAYTPIGRHSPRSLPATPIKTCMYERRGGHLYVWYQCTGGKWTCFESLWFDKDVRF